MVCCAVGCVVFTVMVLCSPFGALFACVSCFHQRFCFHAHNFSVPFLIYCLSVAGFFLWFLVLIIDFGPLTSNARQHQAQHQSHHQIHIHYTHVGHITPHPPLFPTPHFPHTHSLHLLHHLLLQELASPSATPVWCCQCVWLA